MRRASPCCPISLGIQQQGGKLGPDRSQGPERKQPLPRPEGERERGKERERERVVGESTSCTKTSRPEAQKERGKRNCAPYDKQIDDLTVSV